MAKNSMLGKIIESVPEESRGACLAELRACETKDAAAGVLAKYGVNAEERLAELRTELDDAALDNAAGGCGLCSCSGLVCA